MDTSFERSAKPSDEWYTPKWILDSLCEFDLDPCAAEKPLWATAKRHFTKTDNGLIQNWWGRVWLNPPYSRPLVNQFFQKMIEHNNGIALTFNRCDNRLFQNDIFPNATGILFMRGRIKFYRPDGTQGDSSGCGSVLISFGYNNATILEQSGIPGKFIKL